MNYCITILLTTLGSVVLDCTFAADESPTKIASEHAPEQQQQASSLDTMKRFGSLLGQGFVFGKRPFATPIDKDDTERKEELVGISDANFDDKRWLNDIYGTGYFKHKRSKRAAPEKRFIHYYGNVLGRGLSLGKRSELPSLEDDILSFDDSNENSMSKRGILGRGYMFGKRRMFGNRRRRYFGSILGSGFAMGKRGGMDGEIEFPVVDEGIELVPEIEIDETDDIIGGPYVRDVDVTDKRYFHSSPGYRFMLGKRSDSGPDKRYGNLLGRPFSGGIKRLTDKRPFGLVLGNGFSFGKRDAEHPDAEKRDSDAVDDVMLASDKRSGWLLGRGYMLGKRGGKRFGWVLGNGLSFGKRADEPMDKGDSGPNDIYFIDESGEIYQISGDDLQTINDETDMYRPDTEGDQTYYLATEPNQQTKPNVDVEKRAFGLILGRGMSFGKRAPWKRFGHVLGGGYSLGK